MSRPDDTHYTAHLAPQNGTKRGTVCGKWIDRRDHTNEPTCPECLAYVLADRSITDVDAEADRLFGPVRS